MFASVVLGVMRFTKVPTKLMLESIPFVQTGVPRPRPASPACGGGQHKPAQRRRRISTAGCQPRKVGNDVGRGPVEVPVGAGHGLHDAASLGSGRGPVRAARPQSAASDAWCVKQAWCERWMAPRPSWAIRAGALADGRRRRLSRAVPRRALHLRHSEVGNYCFSGETSEA